MVKRKKYKTQKIIFENKKNDKYSDIIKEMSNSCKCVYNTVLFCRRKFYYLQQLHLSLICENIKMYIDKLSPMDRYHCFNYFKKKSRY